MGIAERRERDKENMRRMILDTAMKLFVEDGYETVSIRKIAEKIEYSPATIYLYFKDKDEILYRLHQEGFDALLKRQQTTSSIEEPVERLHRLGEIYVAFALENPEYYELMFIMKAPLKKIDDEWACGFEAYSFFRETVAECINRKRIDAPSADVAAVALWANVHGLVSIIIRERLRMIPEDQIPGLIKAVQAFMQKTIVKNA